MSTLAIQRTSVRPTAVRPTAGRTLTARPTAGRHRTPAPAHARPPVAGARSRPDATRLRLTRRGRLVVVALVLAVLLVGLTAFGSRSAASGEPGTTAPTRTVQVRSGDTLWGIAAEVAEPGQAREMVHRIEKLNALPGPGLTVGQQIAVPVG